MTKRKVYIASKSDHDYSAAKEFGELVFLSEGRVDRYSVGDLYGGLTKALKEATEEDFILISGLTLSNAIASAIMAYRFGSVNYLLFRKGEYMMRKVILGPGVEELFEEISHLKTGDENEQENARQSEKV